MPIEYSLVQHGRPGQPDSPKKWYANARARGATTEREMAEKISRDSWGLLASLVRVQGAALPVLAIR